MPRESFGNLVKHFFYDITHFDSKFFDTLKYLLFRPGFLPKEYIQGRRASYLNPIRMYVFTSAIFFLIFFAIRDTGDSFTFTSSKPMKPEKRAELITDLEEELKTSPGDTGIIKQLEVLRDTTRQVSMAELMAYSDDYSVVEFYDVDYRTKSAYDSAQAQLEKPDRDSWFKRTLIRRQLSLNEKYRENPEQSEGKLSDSILHKLPYLLFVSLPLFALILKLLYVRRKQFYYADHAIFTINHYIFCFLILLLLIIIDELSDATGWGFFSYLVLPLILLLPLYLYIGMKKFYKQGVVKTFFKFLLLNLFGFITIIFLFILFTFLSVFQL